MRAPRSLDPLVHAGRRYVIPVLRRTLPAARLVGTAVSGGTARVLIVDRRLAATRLCRLLFAGEPAVEWAGTVPLTRLRGFIGRQRGAVDLVLATIPRGLPAFLRPKRGILMPGLVELLLPVMPDRESQYRLAHSKRRNRLRRSDRAGFAWRVGSTAEDVHRFIDAYHVPHVTGKFGEDVILQERYILERHARQGGVLWLMVTGLAADLRRTVPSPPEAMFLLSTDLARQLGCRTVSFGSAAPLLREGLLDFKLSLGARVVDYAQSHRELLVDWARPSPVLHALLRAYPPIVRRGRSFTVLTSTVGVDAAAQLAETRKFVPVGVDELLALRDGSDTIDAAMAMLAGASWAAT